MSASPLCLASHLLSPLRLAQPSLPRSTTRSDPNLSVKDNGTNQGRNRVSSHCGWYLLARHPQKGNVIPAAKLREAFEILYPNRAIPEDAFISLQVKEWLEKARNSIGQPLVFKQQNGDLVVLTDEQAVGYLNSQALAGWLSVVAILVACFTHVDADQLSQHGAAQLEVNQAVMH